MSLIVFDFDGTIADSLEVFVTASNRLALEFGYPQVSLEQIPEIQKLSSREVLRQLAIPQWQIPFFLRRFRREVNLLVPELQLISGIQAPLIALHQAGYQLGIVSSNARQTVEAFLQHQALLDRFEFIYAGQVLLGKARALRSLVKQYGVDPSQVICVGDETRDIEAAQQVGVKMLAVSWGFNSREVLASYSPDLLIDQPDQLVAAIQQLQGLQVR